METDRRSAMKAAGLGLGIAALSTSVRAAAVPGGSPVQPGTGVLATDPATLVETRQGTVRGYRDGPVRVFRGIPYAGDTGGANRFLPPPPPPRWAGVRNSMAYGPVCPQPVRTGWRNDDEAFLFHWDDGFPGEDCLRLNVWTTMPGGARRMPVMVWLHGGGFVAGSGQELPAYDGWRLADGHGVVIVSLNHRLGPLGYLDLSEIGGSDYAASGNAGMLDLVAALEWVRDNIAAFGGDPGNVTIFGQSGGGSKVSTLMTMPAAKGLFHRAIVQSGSIALGNDSGTARRFAHDVLAEAGIGRDMDKLRAASPAQLIAAGDTVQRRASPNGPGFLSIGGQPFTLTGWAPVVDGTTLPEFPFRDHAPAVSRDVPLIVGSVRDEFGGVITPITEQELLGRMSALPAERREAVIAAFRRDFPGRSDAAIARTMAATSLRDACIAQATLKAQAGGAPAYLYWFTWASPQFGGAWGSFHCLDLAFSFDNVERWATVTANLPDARPLGRAMSSAWTRFAATGNPSQPGLSWGAFDPARVNTMVFDTQSRMVADPIGNARRLLTR